MKLSDVAGGGDFRPSFFSGGLSVASGVNGNLLALTAPPGKKVRLTGLFGSETGINVTADGVPVVSNLPLSLSGSGNGFAVGKATASSGAVQPGLIDYIEADTTIIVSKVSGSTISQIQYSYAYGG